MKDVARFQKSAGVTTAKRRAPIVAWSSARKEEVYLRGTESIGTTNGKDTTETHVV